MPGRSELPDGAAGARDGDVRGREHVAELIRLRHQHVARTLHPSREGRDSRARRRRGARQARHRPTRRRPSRSATWRPRARRRPPRAAPRSRGRTALALRPGRRRGARAGSAVPRPRPSRRCARDLVGEEELRRERGGEPVGEPEVRVRLGQRGRDPAEPGRQHHRAGDVATAAEDDVGPPRVAGSRGRRTAPARPARALERARATACAGGR